MRKSFTHLMLLFLAVGSVYPLFSQGPSFEVAVVKPIKEGLPAFVVSPGRFRASHVTVRSLIAWAYRIQTSQVSGLQKFPGNPPWPVTEQFEVVASAEGGSSNEELRHMVRQLLADRFSLVLHEEMKEVAVFALTTDSKGHKMKEHPAGVEGGNQISSKDGEWELSFPAGATMTRLANFLSTQRDIGRPVVDRTGLDGFFDFKLRWASDFVTYADTGFDSAPPPPPSPSGSDDIVSLNRWSPNIPGTPMPMVSTPEQRATYVGRGQLTKSAESTLIQSIFDETAN